jgi:hypothetical protein
MLSAAAMMTSAVWPPRSGASGGVSSMPADSIQGQCDRGPKNEPAEARYRFWSAGPPVIPARLLIVAVAISSERPMGVLNTGTFSSRMVLASRRRRARSTVNKAIERYPAVRSSNESDFSCEPLLGGAPTGPRSRVEWLS